MMHPIQMTGWPIVTIQFVRAASDEDVSSWLSTLSDYLSREEAFCLILEANPESRFSPEGRKQLGKWFKSHKTPLHQFCKGVVRLVDSVDRGERLVSKNMKASMPFPMIATLSPEEAKSWTKIQLNL